MVEVRKVWVCYWAINEDDVKTTLLKDSARVFASEERARRWLQHSTRKKVNDNLEEGLTYDAEPYYAELEIEEEK